MKLYGLFALASLLLASLAQAQILVIVHAQNPLAQLEQKQLVDIFMGRVASFPGGNPAQPLDLKPGSPGRGAFYKTLTGKSEAQVDAYWATLVFGGRMSPPRQLDSDPALVQAVAANPAAIAYVARQPLPKGVKVVLELDVAE